jgi:hypothetical protein
MRSDTSAIDSAASMTTGRRYGLRYSPIQERIDPRGDLGGVGVDRTSR